VFSANFVIQADDVVWRRGYCAHFLTMCEWVCMLAR